MNPIQTQVYIFLLAVGVFSTLTLVEMVFQNLTWDHPLLDPEIDLGLFARISPLIVLGPVLLLLAAHGLAGHFGFLGGLCFLAGVVNAHLNRSAR